jgi:class 3 adenylate cyclase
VPETGIAILGRSAVSLFLDIHRNMEDATPESVRKAHLSDLKAQESYGVRYLKYWFDVQRKTVCCLVDAPNKEACAAVHRLAHGGIADEIIGVEHELIAAFLGGDPVDDVGAAVGAAGEPLGAFRTLMFTDIVGSTALAQELGDDEMYRLLRIHDRITREQIERHGGRDVKHTGDGFLACFVSTTAGVACAQSLQRAFAEHREKHPADRLHISIGMSAGEPISGGEGNDLYGSVVNLAARVCARAGRDEIQAAQVVKDLCLGKSFRFESAGTAELKGFPEPVPLYRVVWSPSEE